MEWEPSDIIAAASAGLLLVAIGVSLYLGIKSIRTSSKIEEKKYRMEMLNELASWGIDVLATCHNTGLTKEAILQYKQQRFNLGANRDIIARSDLVSSKAKYFKSRDVNDLIDKISHLVMLAANCITTLGDGKMTMEELGAVNLDWMNKAGIEHPDKEDDKAPIGTVCFHALIMAQTDTAEYLEKVNDLMRAELT